MTKEEFKTCFDQYFDAIRNYIYYKSGDSQLATDIAQDVFLKLWEKDVEFIEIATKSLLYKMANQRFIDFVRKSKVINTYQAKIHLSIKDSMNPQSQMEYKELKKRYELALARLPDKQREVFLMSRIEELTYSEIALRLNISVKAVEKRMYNALQKLRKIIVLAWIIIMMNI